MPLRYLHGASFEKNPIRFEFSTQRKKPAEVPPRQVVTMKFARARIFQRAKFRPHHIFYLLPKVQPTLTWPPGAYPLPGHLLSMAPACK